MIIVRYADDVVAGFEHEDDARRFLDAMRARFGEFALSLHPEATRLIEFGRHAAGRRDWHGLGKPETFSFLGDRARDAGFTFSCGKSRRGTVNSESMQTCEPYGSSVLVSCGGHTTANRLSQV